MPTPFEQIVDRSTKCAKDSVYFSVGLAAVTFQKSQDQVAELRKQFETSLTDGKDQVATLTERFQAPIKALEERYEQIEKRAAEFVDRYGERLPEPVKTAIVRSLESAKSARAQLFDFVLREDAAAAA